MEEIEANGSGVLESTEEYELSQPLGPPNENGDTKLDTFSVEVEECRAVESNANKLLAELTPVKSIRDLTLLREHLVQIATQNKAYADEIKALSARQRSSSTISI